MEESEFYEEQKEKHFNDLISSSTAKRRLSLLHYSGEEAGGHSATSYSCVYRILWLEFKLNLCDGKQ